MLCKSSFALCDEGLLMRDRITPDIFVFNSNNTIASGGYDRICQA